MTAVIRAYALVFVLAAVIAAPSANAGEPAKQIALSGDRAYPESIAAAADGTLFVSSLASGGIWRIKPGSATSEVWIAPGVYDARSTFGVLVDDKKGLLWVCSNDISALGVPGPGAAMGSNLKAFDLISGEGATPHIVVGRDHAGRAAFLWPLCRAKLGPLSVARFFGGKHSNANFPLWRPEVATSVTTTRRASSVTARSPPISRLCTAPASAPAHARRCARRSGRSPNMAP